MTEHINSTKTFLVILCGSLSGLIAGLNPLVWGLFALQVVDIATGLLASKGSWSSAFANLGMRKKVMMWFYVLTGHLLKTISPTPIEVPIDAMIAGYYCIVEVISIIENGGKVGMEAPPPLAKVIKTFISSVVTEKPDGSISLEEKKTVVIETKPEGSPNA